MIKIIILDSNKTIEDSSILIEKEKHIFTKLAKYIDSNYVPCDFSKLLKHKKEFNHSFGKGLWEYHPIFWDSLIKDLYHKYNPEYSINIYDFYLKLYEKFITLYKDVIPFLKAVKGKYKIALAANGNSKRLQIFMKKFNLYKYFNNLIISSETPFRKPDRFMFEYILKKEKCKASEAIMIGDKQTNDISGAKSLGIRTILIKRDDTFLFDSYSPFCIPDFSVKSLKEVKKILNKIKKDKIEIASVKLITSEPKKINSALIVAGGKGKRLGKLGEKYQKSMLKISGKPILENIIETFKAAGCENIVVVIDHLSKQVKEYFNKNKRLSYNISFIEGNFVSTYDALFKSLDKLDNEFYYCHGNVLFPERLLEVIWSIFNKDKSCLLTLVKNSKSIKHLKIMELKDNFIKKVALDTNNPNESDFTFLGLSIYRKDIILKYHKQENNKKMAESFILEALKDNFPIKGYVYKGKWYHLENYNDYIYFKNKYQWELNFNNSNKK